MMRPEWLAVRAAVLSRDDHRCIACGEDCRGEAHVHHLIPGVAGGDDDPSNLITLCPGCHAAHHPNLQVGLARRAIVAWGMRLAKLLDTHAYLSNLDSSLEVALRLFGVPRLRHAQLDVILAALRGESVLFVSATGSGKTLCFQLPALLRPGVAYVISPLKALMRDQVGKLQERKIPGSFINGDLGPEEKKKRYDLLHRGALKFLYCTPEPFAADRVRTSELEQLLNVNPAWFIIDEAHCIVRWGRDFRPTYGRLGAVRTRLGSPQVLALTATVGKSTQDQILQSLGIPDARVIVTGVDRPNIAIARIETDKNEERLALVQALLNDLSGRMMIFVPTLRVGQRLQSELEARGIDVPFYQSKLGSATEKEMLLSRFIGRIHPPLKAVICTNAFGMGIDVPDVRIVLHWQPPASVEDYLQEYGRAGRDGLPALAILLTSKRDEGLLQFMARKTAESAHVDPSERGEVLDARLREISTMHLQPERLKPTAAYDQEVKDSPEMPDGSSILTRGANTR